VRRSASWLVAVTAVVVICLDQLSKVWAVAALTGRQPIEVVGSWLQLVLVRNSGAAFSLGGGSTVIISLLAVVIVVVLIRRARGLKSKLWALALGAMIGGALGNLTDRLVRSPGGLRGHVVDFIQLPHWPVFNIADMAVVGAAILMVVLALRGIEFDGSRAAGKALEQPTEAADGPPAESR
jgi:signal peptidase II